ncbi:MAG: winged helix DNA-binding domain-containing protein [Nitrososphaerales archaeon]
MGIVTGRTAIQQQRLCQQRLAGNPLPASEEVVSWLGAVQAQDYAGAKWALGLRTQGTTDALVDKAFNEGKVLRTHMMRPTWHFVTPEDIRWIQALTASRVNAVNAHMYRQHELDDSLFARANAIITQALQGRQQLTREELGDALGRAGIMAAGNRLAYIILRAELDGVVCSGPRRGKQFTYMLLEERAPQGRVLARDEALAELTRRYFVGHGPATVRDFAWWSGLSIVDVKKGIEAAERDLASEEVLGTTYWFSRSISPLDEHVESTLLLPTYDEFLIGFTGDSRGGQDVNELVFDSTIVIDGKIAGAWRRVFEKGSALVQVKMVTPHQETDERVTAAVERFGAFLEMPVRVEWIDVSELKSTGWRFSRLSKQDRAEANE